MSQDFDHLSQKLRPTPKRRRVGSSQLVSYTSSTPQAFPVAAPAPTPFTQLTTPNIALGIITPSPQHRLRHSHVICCIRYSRDGRYLAAASRRVALIFDIATGQNVATFLKKTGKQVDHDTHSHRLVRAVCFSPDSNWLITGAEDGLVEVWNVRHANVKHRFVGHEEAVYSIDASANSDFVVSGSGDNKVKVWGLTTGKLLTTLGGECAPNNGITSVSLCTTSRYVATGCLDDVVRVWDVESQKLVRQLHGHRDSVYSVAFSSNENMLLSGSLDKTLKLWDLRAPYPFNRYGMSFTGHRDLVLSVTFSRDGRRIFSGSRDQTARITGKAK